MASLLVALVEAPAAGAGAGLAAGWVVVVAPAAGVVAAASA
jgi:hypothetical protein